MSRRSCRGVRRAATALRLGLAVTAGLALLPAPMRGQSESRPERAHPQWSLELGGALATSLVEDGHGVVVRMGPAVVLGGNRIIAESRRAALGVGMLGAASRLTVRSSGEEWSPGSSARFDLGLRVDGHSPFETVTSFGAAVTHVTGPAGTIPFRKRASLTSWSAHLGIGRDIRPNGPLGIVVAGDVLRIPARLAEDMALHAGWVGRIRVALRYAL